MDIKKINVEKLSKDYKEVYDELKSQTANFDEDVVGIFKSEIKEFLELVKEDVPEAIKPSTPKETKTTISGDPTNVSQLKKWLKQNIGEKIFTSAGFLKITKVQAHAFLTVDKEGKEHPFGFPKASDTSYSKTGFSLGNDFYAYKRSGVKKEAPKKRTPSASTKRTLERIKKDTDLKSQTQGRTDGDLIRDINRQAKSPGKRITKHGTVYYERRPNRVDVDQNIHLKRGGNVGVVVRHTKNSPWTFIADEIPRKEAEKVMAEYKKSGKKHHDIMIDDLPFKKGGSVGRGRDLLFQSQQDHEKKYAKKKNIQRLGYKKKKKLNNGGKVSEKSSYVGINEIEYVELDNGAIVRGDDLYSGLYVANNPVAFADPSQTVLKFKTGGKLSDRARYIPRTKIAKVVLEDKTVIKSESVMNGFWIWVTDRDRLLLKEYYEANSKKNTPPKKKEKPVFDEKLGGNDFYTYKGQQIMFAPANRIVPKDEYYVSDKMLTSMAKAVAYIDKSSFKKSGGSIELQNMSRVNFTHGRDNKKRKGYIVDNLGDGNYVVMSGFNQILVPESKITKRK